MPEEKPHVPFEGVEPPASRDASRDGQVESDHEKEKIERLRRAMYSRALEPNIKEKPRHELEAGTPPIGEDWQHPDDSPFTGTIAAPKKLHVMRVLVQWLIYAGVAFGVGAGGFLAYYFFLGGGSVPASPGNIDIVVSGPLQVQSGTPTKLQIAIVNRNRVPLELADLVVTFPKGTRSVNDLTTSLPDLRESLGTIEPGGQRRGTISAVFAGQEGERATVKVELEYRLAGSSAIFVSSTDYQIMFSSSPISLSIEGNSETISGQPVEFTATVASNAEAPVKDVLLNINFPFGFTLSHADPQPVAGSRNLWALGDLAPGQQKSVLVRGSVLGESGDERVIRFTAGTRTSEEKTAIDAVLADYAHHVTVSNPFLGLTIDVNKDQGASGAIAGPGETVNVAVQWQNNLSTPIIDAVIVAQLSGIEIDGTTVRTNDGFYRSSDRVVLWDKSTTNGSLASLAPGARGTVSFSFSVPSNDELRGLRDPKVTISVQAAGRRIAERDVPETLQSTASQTIRVASDLQLIAQGLYYSNPLSSSGPIPPKAGEETTYGIVLSVTNTTNRITNAVVKAALPPYVRWTGIFAPASADISFNQNDGTFTWRLGTIEPGTGTEGIQVRQLGINIAITPSTSQIGQQPVLIRAIQLTGIDEATGETVSRSATDVTTNINTDPGFTPANATVVK
ncbi:MAG TPA: hypothetical protein VNM40_03775 [Candidatus Paceibacterota bacterium]|nr:hypothetical protein [Candidatus Paceibacterota bacterium]